VPKPERDPALLPGTSAGIWRARSGVVRWIAIAVFLAALAFEYAVGVLPAGVEWLTVLALPIVLTLCAIALAQKAGRVLQRELVAGYTTYSDAPGYDLRHPATGYLFRGWKTPPAPRAQFLLRFERPKAWAKRYPAAPTS
jgi:hypothetical protein